MTKKHGTDGHQTVKTAGPVELNRIAETLAEREIQHGPFANHAKLECALKAVVFNSECDLTEIQAVGLAMIIHKIARILNRGNQHSDTWHDIAGYATLVEKSILDE